MKAALVTGANGFVGKALCTELGRRNLSARGAIRGPLSPLGSSYGVVSVGSIGSETDWTEALKEVGVVVHLAARVHVMRDKAVDPLIEFRAVNVEATLNLARQAAKTNVQRFVYLSSIKVNGEQTLPGQPFTERDVAAPLDPYGISKFEAEEGLRKIAQQTGMEVVVIRPPLVYGPGVKANFLSMMRHIYNGIPLPLGAIHNKRSLVALDNLVDFILTCIDHPAAANQVFLVSDGEDMSTTELLQRTAVALGKPVRLLPMPQGWLELGLKLLGKSDLAQRLCGSLQVDINKTQDVLGWQPPISVDEGLRKTAEEFLRTGGR
jgi:nucleoside-diphosphate-sugar epimerase